MQLFVARPWRALPASHPAAPPPAPLPAFGRAFGLAFGSILGAILGAILLGGSAAAQGSPDLVFTAPGLMPEGVEYHAPTDRFLVGSFARGTIHAVHPDGSVAPLIEDEALMSSVGIEVDEAHGRLLVVNADPVAMSDPGASGRAELLAFDLQSGERLFHARLDELLPQEGVRFLANDVAVDADGHAYVTNTLAPVIFRVSPEGTPEVFVHDERLAGSGFGLNGVEVHPDGFLLAAVMGGGQLFRIPLDDPGALAPVTLPEPLAIDGMVLDDAGRLVAVAFLGTAPQGAPQAVVALTSDDGWHSAGIVARQPTGGAATTVALRGGVPHYLNAYINDPERASYEIVRAELGDE